jgi:2'-5' RNA ligase
VRASGARRAHGAVCGGNIRRHYIMRLFVAVVLSHVNQLRLRAPVDQLVKAHADVLRATPDGTLHLTMAFMGRADAQDVAAIGEAMQQVAQRCAPFAIELSAPRVLRVRQDPRLVLLPVVGDPPQMEALMRDLHRAVTDRLPSLEVSSAKSAHVTLARFRKHARASDARVVEQSLAQAGVASLVLHEEVRDIRLFESQLGAGGPRYRNLQNAPLRING